MAESGMTRVATDTFALAIDYSQTLAEMVAAGAYDYTSMYITEEHFPVGEGAAQVEAIRGHDLRHITSATCWLN